MEDVGHCAVEGRCRPVKGLWTFNVAEEADYLAALGNMLCAVCVHWSPPSKGTHRPGIYLGTQMGTQVVMGHCAARRAGALIRTQWSTNSYSGSNRCGRHVTQAYSFVLPTTFVPHTRLRGVVLIIIINSRQSDSSGQIHPVCSLLGIQAGFHLAPTLDLGHSLTTCRFAVG